MPPTSVEQIPLFAREGTPDVVSLRQAREAFAAAARAPLTERAYALDWADFAGWCEAAGRGALPASEATLELYLVDLEKRGRKVATIQRRLSAIRSRHLSAGQANPAGERVKELMRAISREVGVAQQGKAALTAGELRAISEALGRSLVHVRDRALLVLGFASALRRSELSALDLADLRFVREGLVLRVRRSKNDQKGEGREIGIFRGRRPSTCPVRTMQAWLKLRGQAPGPLFLATDAWKLTGRRLCGPSICAIVKRCVEEIGLNPARYGAHSLRAGMVTAAIEAGVPESLVMQRSGHKSLAVMARYVRPARLFTVDPLARAL